MKDIKIGKRVISETGDCFMIAEIGHNHQGDLQKALEMIEVAAQCGADAVKFQKRDNKALYTSEQYNAPYENENSFGSTYGEHREFLEFGWDEYVQLKKCAEENNVEFMCTPFDFQSVEFLEKLGVSSYKLASADITNTPLINYVASFKKPVFISTGACTMEEIAMAYETVLKHTDKLVLFHCVSAYPPEYENLNLRIIMTLKREFPKAIIGYSGHDNGILAPVIAAMLGARVFEKHFTINHSWKGTDHKFSLEPTGLRKQIRNLRRIGLSLGTGTKVLNEYELAARIKMGKSLYSSRALERGQILSCEDIVIKSPGKGVPPYKLDDFLGKKLLCDMPAETLLSYEHIESHKECYTADEIERLTISTA
ncbi:MAG: N-acetylneuraminate synthase family protein [Candidatus Auribacterota bacterium]|jgi:N-acetylneuraminate synthase/sialic acid synthase|nr:N-acetylneuraminate synthase family protein [Candidatus Auribacterota bacterium]